MPNVRHVCLSDLHLGAGDSILTNQTNPRMPSPALRGLAAILSEICRRNDPGCPKPGLILAGDFLELALSPTERALTVAEQFFRLTANLFSEIILIPGNHDHHLWEAARETQYLEYLRNLPAGVEPAAPWSTTKIFMDMSGKDRLVCRLLSEIAGRDVLMAYPNFGLRAKNGKGVIFHHGHFTEPVYHLMSSLMSLIFPGQSLPQSVYELEKENAAWIDFLWSLQGNCGRVGRDVGALYYASADERRVRTLAGNLIDSLARRGEVPGIGPAWLRTFVFRKLLDRCLVQRIAGAPDSESSEAGFAWYFSGLLPKQIADEAVPVFAPALVFGHTHKPYESIVRLDPYFQPVRVFNTGGWVIDTRKPDPDQGAAAVLLDENLNAVSLRFFNQGRYGVRVSEPLPHTAFYDRVRSYVKPDLDPWRSFNQIVQDQLEEHAAETARAA